MILKPILQWYYLVLIFGLPSAGVLAIGLTQPKEHRKRWLLRLLILLLLAGIGLRPSISGGTVQGGLENVDVLYVVDTTSSMAAEDYNGNKLRLEGVKNDIMNLTKNLTGARFSLISFNSKPHLDLPFTTDTSAVGAQASTLNQEITYYSQGSSIDLPVDTAKAQLNDAMNNHPDRARLLFYFGDGEQTADSAPKSFESLKPSIDGGAVLGYGTESGGKMKEYTGYEKNLEDGYIKDYSARDGKNPDAISKIDESNLQTIAKQLGIRYEHRTEQTDTASIVNNIPHHKLEKTSRDASAATDLYWLLTLPIGILLLLDLRRIHRLMREIKATK